MMLSAGFAFAPALVHAQAPLTLGLTPVFLTNDYEVLDRLHRYLTARLDMPVEFVQRRTYQEVTGLLLDGVIDGAWICGDPYAAHIDRMALMGVPVWQGKPMYRSYLIAAPDSAATSLADLRGTFHAFSDPDSNSGYLVTASDLAMMNERPETFFSRTMFTYGHRNVVRAVASGLAQSGSVDGYVWEVLAKVEPNLTVGTRVVQKSELLGFPPFACRRDRAGDARIVAFSAALQDMADDPDGRAALALLQLDGIAAEPDSLFDGIARRLRILAERG
jgi:phosphonate transport system substrate-binding protein